MKVRLLALFIILQLSSCIYTDIKFPLDRDVWETKLGSKTGISSSHSILWLVAWGDAGLKRAALNGNLSVINHLDMHFESYLFGAYTKTETIAYGD